MWEAMIISGGIVLGMGIADSVLSYVAGSDYAARGQIIMLAKLYALVFMGLVVGVVL